MLAADAGSVMPRFSKLSDTQGLVHFMDATGAHRVEIDVEGVVGAIKNSDDFAGVTFGVEYAATSASAVAVRQSFLADGGLELLGAQCR